MSNDKYISYANHLKTQNPNIIGLRLNNQSQKILINSILLDEKQDIKYGFGSVKTSEILEKAPLTSMVAKANKDRTTKMFTLCCLDERQSLNQAPLNQAPSDQAPLNQAPSDQAPSDQAPSDQAPSDQAPSDQALQSSIDLIIKSIEHAFENSQRLKKSHVDTISVFKLNVYHPFLEIDEESLKNLRTQIEKRAETKIESEIETLESIGKNPFKNSPSIEITIRTKSDLMLYFSKELTYSFKKYPKYVEIGEECELFEQNDHSEVGEEAVANDQLKKSFVLSTYFSAYDCLKLYEEFGELLFAFNPRRYLGPTVQINQQIIKTLNNTPEFFHYCNNGLLVISEEIERSTSLIKKISKFSILNGGQSFMSIMEYCRQREQLQKQPMTEKEKFETFGQIKIIVKLIQLPTFEDPSNTKISKSEISLAANSNTPVKEENRYVFEDFFKKIKMDIIHSNYQINENPPDQTNQSNHFSIAEVSAAALVFLEKSNLAVKETTETLYKLIRNGTPQPNTKSIIGVALLINYLSDKSNIDSLFKVKSQIHALLTKKDVDHRYAYFLVSKLLFKKDLTETDLNSFFDNSNQVDSWVKKKDNELQNFANHFYLTYSSKHSRDDFLKATLYSSFLSR